MWPRRRRRQTFEDVWAMSLGRVYPPVKLDTCRASLESWRGYVWGAIRHPPARMRPSGPSIVSGCHSPNVQ
eukprot:275036-Rhodomonas_salina.1